MGATLITGAGGGIGRAAARRLAEAGRALALLDLSADALAGTIAACAGGSAPPPLALACDVTDDEAVRQAVEAAVARFGAVESLVLAAGIGRYAPFLDTTMDEWSAFLDVNVLGIVRTIRAALPAMIERGHGRFVLLSSRRGLEPGRETAAYSATKAALHGMAGALAQEVGPRGIGVTLLCPGGVRSDFRNIPGAGKDPRWLEVEDVADAITFALDRPAKAWVRQLDLLPLGF